MADLNSITEALIKGDRETTKHLVQSAVDEGAAAREILDVGLIRGMDIVGDKMESGDMFIPEVLQCARIMSEAVEILKPHLGADAAMGAGKVVIGTVKGDLHDIGKNLVKMMMESAGFQVTDLGVDVSPEKFVQTVQSNNGGIVALSALLTTTMPMMKRTVDALVESGLRDKVKIMVGGAPVTQKFADDIGADGYAVDAGSASKLAKRLLH
jgi:5-methyltetrahydrofolate--homocysteine methyltransferase